MSFKQVFCIFTFVTIAINPTDGIASQDQEAEFSIGMEQGTLEVSILESHLKIEDDDGNISTISMPADGIVELDQSSQWKSKVTVFDIDQLTWSDFQSTTYEELLGDAVVTGPSGEHFPISSIFPPDDENFIQSWGCVGATLQLVAAAGAVVVGCSPPHGAATCGFALIGYAGAAVNYWEACTHN